ncbi:MAG: response regulator transcription factor [Oscillospiraceae bacterium]|nr:response regulator transcription factor [Oscillospiraceae bacterium]
MDETRKPRILIADDDRDIAFAISKLLSDEGYECERAYNGAEAVEAVRRASFDLAVLDVMMPRIDGLSVMMKIRQSGNIPVIILSAKSEETDKILGLGMGADDYVTKPYSPAELIARVRSALRRYLVLGAGTQFVPGDRIRIGGLELNRAAKNVTVDGEPVKLTATEYKILELLMENKNRVFSPEEIYSRVWENDAYSVENTVMVHIRRIREKIEIDPKEPKYLVVVWGIGYKIEG